MNRKLRPTVDVLLTAALLALTGYQFWGPSVHEGLGLAFVAGVVFHLCLSLSRAGWRRLGVLEALLTADLALLALTGISMAHSLFTVPFTLVSPSLARPLHRILAHGALVLVGLHIGLRFRLFLGLAGMKTKAPAKRLVRVPLSVSAGLVCLYGLVAAVQRGFFELDLASNLLRFANAEEPVIPFLADHLAILFLAVCVGALFRHRKDKR